MTFYLTKCSSLPWKQVLNKLTKNLKALLRKVRRSEDKRFPSSAFASSPLKSSFSFSLNPFLLANFWLQVFLLLSFCLWRWVSISCLNTSIPSWPWEASFMALDCMHILYCSGVSSSRHCFSCQRWKRPLMGVLITMRLLWRYLRYRCTSSPPQPLMSRSKPPDTKKIQNNSRNMHLPLSNLMLLIALPLFSSSSQPLKTAMLSANKVSKIPQLQIFHHHPELLYLY